jgi:hypothetical protein
MLTNELRNAFGIAEMWPISRGGEIRQRYWTRAPIAAGAQRHGITTTQEIIA